MCEEDPRFELPPAGPFPAPAPAAPSKPVAAPKALPNANLPPPVNPVKPAFLESWEPGPAPGPAPAPAFCSDHGDPKTAKTTFTIANVSFDLLEKAPKIKDGFVNAVQASTASSAGTQFDANQVKVTMAGAASTAFVQFNAGQAPAGGVAVSTSLLIPSGEDS